MFDLQAAQRAQQAFYQAQDLAMLIKSQAQAAVQCDPEATLAVLKDALERLKAIPLKPVRPPDAP